MDSSQAIRWMIIICVLFIFYILLSKQIKTIVKIIIQGFIGLVGIYLVNFIAAPLGASVGINFLTWFIIGVLGLPGGVLLYAVAALIK